MGRTGVNFAEFSWSPVRGCSAQHDGSCKVGVHCWAAQLAGTRLAHLPQYRGVTEYTGPSRDLRGPLWTGEVRFDAAELAKPLHWRKPRVVLCSLMGDWMDPGVSDVEIVSMLDVMRRAHWHTFLTLTKRAQRLPVVLRDHVTTDNIWHGVSICDQADADERLAHLFTLKAQGWHTWAIAEPLLGPIVLHPHLTHYRQSGPIPGRAAPLTTGPFPTLDAMVVGPENHAGARPCNPEWIRDLVRQCAAAGVPCYVKSGLNLGDPCYVMQTPWAQKGE